MGTRTPLTVSEKEEIYHGKLAGQTLRALAAQVRCSAACVRKWWRVGREHGLTGLRTPRRTRATSGLLSRFAPNVAVRALYYKRLHPGWGAKRVRLELQADPLLEGCRLPTASRLAFFFKRSCPDCVAGRQKAKPALRPLRATAVHELWQLDSQEGIALDHQLRATLCNVRDPVGAAMIASQGFEVTTPKRWRKLTFPELRSVLRTAFTEWGTLPDGVQTDNELRLAGDPNEQFPSDLTLWLAGLGIVHRFIRPGHPRDQAQIERNHRTLDGLVLNASARQDVSHLQAALARERTLYNQASGCLASDCAGQPPLRAHPELLRPRRPYRPEWELVLFDLARVQLYLTRLALERKVSLVGQVQLGGVRYALGRTHAGKTLQIQFDAQTAQWVFREAQGNEVARHALQGLGVAYLTGLDPTRIPPPTTPVQLTLPFFL